MMLHSGLPRAPGRFDAILIPPNGRRLGVMLQGSPYDVQSSKQDEQAAVSPTNYSPNSRNPFVEGTRTWGNWVEGDGAFVREKDETHDSAVGNGVDGSLGGVLILGPASVSVIPSGTGITLASIEQIVEMQDASYRRLYALAGNQVWECSGDPGNAADWARSKDFALTLGSTSTPVIANVGSGGAVTYAYKIVHVGISNPPASDPSGAGSTATGNATLDGTNYNTVTFTTTLGERYEVWRTTGGTVGRLATVTAAGASTVYNDQSATVVELAGAPNVIAVTQTPMRMMSYFYSTSSNLYVGVGTGTYWRFNGTTWTQAPLQTDFSDCGMGSLFGQVGRFFYRSLGASASGSGNHIYRSVGDPFGTGSGGATNWNSYSGDSGEFPYTALAFCNDQLVSFETGRIGVGSTIYEISPFRARPSIDNGRTAIVWADPSGELAIYAPYGGAFYKIVPSSFTDARVESIGPEKLVQNRSDITGVVTCAVGHDAYYLYFCLYHSADNTTYLCKLGSWLNPEGHSSTRWEWVPNLHLGIASWSGVQARSMFISNISGTGTTSSPRLIIGMDDGSFRLIVLPESSPHPLADTRCRFLAEGWKDLPADDAGYGANLKSYHRATLLGKTLNEGQTATVSYRLDGADELADVDGDFTASGQSKDFADGVQAHSIAPRINLATDDSTLTPEVHELQIHAQVRGPSDAYGNPGFVRQRRLAILCEDGLVDNQGHPLVLRSAQQIRAAVQQACAATDAHLILEDGVTRQISVTNFTEGTTLGPDGQVAYTVTLDYLERTLATGTNATNEMDPGWGP